MNKVVWHVTMSLDGFIAGADHEMEPAPVLPGDGARLYGGEGAPRIELERVFHGDTGQLTDLHFRTVR